MTTSVRALPLGDRLRRATAHATETESLARVVFDVLAVEVPYDFACLAPVDPASGLIVRAFKSRPVDIGDRDFAAAEWGGPDVNRFADLAGRPVPVGVLSVDTDGDVLRCRRFREYMAPRFGFTDELRATCRSGETVWAALALYRGAGERAFTVADGHLLAGAHEAIADAVRRTVLTGARPEGSVGPAVFVLDTDGGVVDLSAAAYTAVEELGGWDHGELPAGLLAAAAQARSTGDPVLTRLRAHTGRWLTVQAVSLAGVAAPSVVLTVDAAPQSAVGQLTIAACGLTAREQEVTGLVLRGMSTKDIAGALHLSPHTVQDHLKSIFDKLGVNSRREMIAQLALTAPAD